MRSGRIGSLFSGVGGLELGLEWAGLGHTVWQVEQSEFCRDVLARHWPHAERFEDVREVGAAELVPVDLLCGGFPCTDVSSAGKGAGLAGERSGLWFEFARIIEELQPEWVVIENVASGAKRWVDQVRSHLGELGYETLPVPLSASSVGAPHLRRRIFFIAYSQRHALRDGAEWLPRRRSSGICGQGEAEPVHDGKSRHPANTDESRLEGAVERGRQARSGVIAQCDQQASSDADGRRCKGQRKPAQRGEQCTRGSLADGRGDPWSRIASTRGEGTEFRPPMSPVRDMDDGISPRLAREQLQALGNAVVPQCAEIIGWMIREIIEGTKQA